MSFFITSDEHIGHANIINLANRPFTSLVEMRETIVERHNKKVPDSKGHTTIHVGDMFWQSLTVAEAVEYLARLHGRHGFLYGNHDNLIESSEFLRNNFDWVVGENEAGGSKVLRWNRHKILLSHYAHRVWPGSHKGHWHLYGHSHNALPGVGKSFDIGVDGHNFEPWSMEEIEARMATLPQHHSVNNTGAGMVDNVREGHTRDGKCFCADCNPVCSHLCVCQCDEVRRGSTVHYHPAGETCGFCQMGG